jgi:glycosyltransferase involved in cell wall biosynthesis
LDFGIPERGVRQVYPAIDTGLVEKIRHMDLAQVRGQLGLNQDEIYLNCVSRVAPGKNIEEFLKTWKEMQATRFDSQGNLNTNHSLNQTYGDKRVNLILIGGASEGQGDEEYLQALAEANQGGDERTSSTVISQQEMSDSELIAKYTYAADLYVLPSQSEGFNLTVLRALALAKSTIVYEKAQRDSGLGELIIPGQTGTVFDAFKGESLAAAIKTAETAKEQLTAGALAHINSEHKLQSHEAATNTMLGIYNEVTRERPFSILVTSTFSAEEP